jgi:hypothetical protein
MLESERECGDQSDEAETLRVSSIFASKVGLETNWQKERPGTVGVQVQLLRHLNVEGRENGHGCRQWRLLV